jgi:hypothetical protein
VHQENNERNRPALLVDKRYTHFQLAAMNARKGKQENKQETYLAAIEKLRTAPAHVAQFATFLSFLTRHLFVDDNATKPVLNPMREWGEEFNQNRIGRLWCVVPRIVF